MGLFDWVCNHFSARKSATQSLNKRSIRLVLEALERRDCPSSYEWIAPRGSFWSNPGGGDWNVMTAQGWQLAPAGAYPGDGATVDSAVFDVFAAGAAIMDVALQTPLGGLIFNGWAGGTLTLRQPLTVQAGGDFQLVDGSNIWLDDGVVFTLANAVGSWTNGDIIGAANASFQVNGGQLGTGAPGPGPGPEVNLGVNMVIQQGGVFSLNDMVGNLNLTGGANSIDVGTGGRLNLSQAIKKQQQPNTVGGISLDPGHNGGTVAVQVELGGTLSRASIAHVQAVVPDQVAIGGSVHNVGGTVDVGETWLLNITGKDANGISYLQQTQNTALLLLEAGANLKAAGTFQISSGTVTLTAPSGDSDDELDGLGLNFSGTTAFNIVDSTLGTPGTVTVQGPITLAVGTTTTVNYNGGTNQSDLLDDKNGLFTLAGTFNMLSGGTGAPTQPLNFFDDSGTVGAFAGNFTTWIGDIAGATYNANQVPVNGLLMYQVTITGGS